MGTGKSKKKSTKKSTKKKSNPERDILSEQLKKTGPFILREFCAAHGMEGSDKSPKNELVKFLEGKFDDGEITMNDLYPEEDPEDVDIDDDDNDEEEESPKKSTKKKSTKKSTKKPAKKRTKKKKPEPEEEDDDDDDDDLEDDDDDLDDDDLDIDDDDDDDEDDEDPKSKKEVSSLEDKIDKLMDLSTKMGSAIDDLTQLQLEHKEFSRLATTYLVKLGGVDKVKAAKLVKKMEKKAKEAVCEDEQEEE